MTQPPLPRFPHNTLDALCAWLRSGGGMTSLPNATLIALHAGVYAELDGIPIHPPVHLDAGAKLELWWYIEGGVIEYQHAGTRAARELGAPRRQLLTLLAMRRLLLETFGHPGPGLPVQLPPDLPSWLQRA